MKHLLTIVLIVFSGIGLSQEMMGPKTFDFEKEKELFKDAHDLTFSPFDFPSFNWERNIFLNENWEFFLPDNLFESEIMLAGGSHVGNGGDAVFCYRSNDNDFYGFYALDYLLTYIQSISNDDMAVVNTWEESRDRILNIFKP